MASFLPSLTATDQGNPAWLYVGVDERGRELEIVAVEIRGNADHDAVLLVIHVMPTQLRGNDRHA